MEIRNIRPSGRSGSSREVQVRQGVARRCDGVSFKEKETRECTTNSCTSMGSSSWGPVSIISADRQPCRSSGSRQEAVVIAYTARQRCTSSWSWQEAKCMSATFIFRNEQKS
jgi:hypothetical protein